MRHLDTQYCPAASLQLDAAYSLSHWIRAWLARIYNLFTRHGSTSTSEDNRWSICVGSASRPVELAPLPKEKSFELGKIIAPLARITENFANIIILSGHGDHAQTLVFTNGFA